MQSHSHQIRQHCQGSSNSTGATSPSLKKEVYVAAVFPKVHLPRSQKKGGANKKIFADN